MAPLALSDRNTAIDSPVECVAPRRNLTSAVNYESESRAFDQFRRNSNRKVVQLVLSSSHTAGGNQPQLHFNSINMNFQNTENLSPDSPKCDAMSAGVDRLDCKRIRSEDIDKKVRRDSGVARCRVRYDMQLVPSVKRNKQFLLRFPIWWQDRSENDRHARRLALAPLISSDDGLQVSMSPFQEDISVVWIPSTRLEWEDSVQEMTAVCTSAAIRRYSSNPWTVHSKPFQPPLSREYIKDRIDIDDPLEGFQIRCRNGGWLQGFILYTNFTTWTHGFKWDSKHPMSGIIRPSDDHQLLKVDYDGSLADELDGLPRSGDPQGTGIVFPDIAEIGLVGGLSCGEYLLRMALDSIQAKSRYRYVVLQATEQSRMFYEEFGFIRVGSICRYGKGLLPPEEDTPFTGYRHWTHANESEKSLEMHGGPSYMMCLKLPDEKVKAPECAQSSFLTAMMNLVVRMKPIVANLGVNSSSRSKLRNRKGTMPLEPTNSGHCLHSGIGARGKKSCRRRRSVNESAIDLSKRSNDSDKYCLSHSSTYGQTLLSRQSASPDDEDAENTPKRRKFDSLSNIAVEHNDGLERIKVHNMSTDLLVSRPPDGTRLSYVQKQYHSVWLAVPPKTLLPSAPRPPPKLRARNTAKLHSSRSSDNGAKSESPIACRAGLRAVKSRFMKKSLDSIAGLSTDARNRPESSTPSESSMNHKPVYRATFMKQKVKSYPRTRLHYYNKVVKPKIGSLLYYFVLHFDEKTEAIRIVPMQARGLLTGKREGRPRYQAIIGDSDANFLTVYAKDYQVVSSAMVMKTPVVALEAWDIEDD